MDLMLIHINVCNSFALHTAVAYIRKHKKTRYNHIIMNKKYFILSAIILSAAFLRLLPHEPNFTPLGAIALFSGAYIANVYIALAMPILSMLLGDALLGFSGWAYPTQMLVVYGSFALVTLLGRGILQNNKNFLRVGGAAIASSLVFFFITNFAVWVNGFWGVAFYPTTFAGLIECYVAGIPFYKTSLYADVVYTAVFFGGFYLARINVPALQSLK
jgi:hypothetical protein